METVSKQNLILSNSTNKQLEWACFNVMFYVIFTIDEEAFPLIIRRSRHDKIYFVTGGVVSSLGKGITASSLGRLLKDRGLNVTIQKFDPYLNVDPGTMSPYQHGEVFVTDDGAETDLDLGHYERFIDINLNKFSNVTAGKVYSHVLKKNVVVIT